MCGGGQQQQQQTETKSGSEGVFSKSRQKYCSLTRFRNVCVRVPNFCESTLTGMRPSHLESGRLCKGKHKGCSKLGAKRCDRNLQKYQLSTEIFACELGAALTGPSSVLIDASGQCFFHVLSVLNAESSLNPAQICFL